MEHLDRRSIILPVVLLRDAREELANRRRRLRVLTAVAVPAVVGLGVLALAGSGAATVAAAVVAAVAVGALVSSLGHGGDGPHLSGLRRLIVNRLVPGLRPADLVRLLDGGAATAAGFSVRLTEVAGTIHVDAVPLPPQPSPLQEWFPAGGAQA